MQPRSGKGHAWPGESNVQSWQVMDFPFQSGADASPRARARQGPGSSSAGCPRARVDRVAVVARTGASTTCEAPAPVVPWNCPAVSSVPAHRAADYRL